MGYEIEEFDCAEEYVRRVTDFAVGAQTRNEVFSFEYEAPKSLPVYVYFSVKAGES
jgi:hypothetical protein